MIGCQAMLSLLLSIEEAPPNANTVRLQILVGFDGKNQNRDFSTNNRDLVKATPPDGVLERSYRNSDRGKPQGIRRLSVDLRPKWHDMQQRTLTVGIQHGQSRRYV